MRFSIHGYIVDTSDKTEEEKIEEYLMLLVCVYFPHIKVDKVCYKFDAETNTAEIIFEREAKILVMGDILDTDAQLITSPEPQYSCRLLPFPSAHCRWPDDWESYS